MGVSTLHLAKKLSITGAQAIRSNGSINGLLIARATLHPLAFKRFNASGRHTTKQSAAASPYADHFPNAATDLRGLEQRLLQPQVRVEDLNPTRLDFGDAGIAFKSKTLFELARAWAIFKICTFRPFVDNAEKILDVSEKILGKSVTLFFVRHSFFNHFCAGQDADDIQGSLERLRASGVGGILDYAAEADVGHGADAKGGEEATMNGSGAMEVRDQHREDVVSARVFDYAGEAYCDANRELFLSAIEAASRQANGFVAVKLTALGKPSLLQAVSSSVLQARKIWFDHFCNSENDSIDFQQFQSGLKSLGLKLDEQTALNLFTQFDYNENGRLDYLDWTEQIRIESMTSETSPLIKLLKAAGIPTLSDDETALVDNMILRLRAVCDYAREKRVRLMIDAEQTYMQGAIDHITRRLQQDYNRDFPLIFNTFQCYLTYSKKRLENDLERARREGWYFAAKLVRGAYMHLERRLAEEEGRPSPIHATLQDTHDNFDDCVDTVLRNIHRSNLMIASHNQTSMEKTVDLMARYNINRETGGVFFGQLLGMADHLSFTLGQNGYSAYKYVPYGPIDEVLPYLLRRAHENSDLLGGTSHERDMIKDAILQRIGLKRQHAHKTIASTA
eukprot:Clim_evm20s210 gene=Clim_evmTU20s210